MAEPIDLGYAFNAGPLWPHADLESEQIGGFFASPDFELSLLETGKDDRDGTHEHELRLPELGVIEGLDTLSEDGPSEDFSIIAPSNDDSPQDAAGDLSDIWDLEHKVAQEAAAPRLRTWEAFEKKTSSPLTERTNYISEAGPMAFDAVLASGRSESQRHVLPQGVLLRSLCNLALGRASIFFQWDNDKQYFSQTLKDVPTSGLSVQSSGSLIAWFREYGSMSRRLRGFADSINDNKEKLSATTALKRSISDVLEALESHVIQQFESTRSLLQLRNLLERPQELLKALCAMKDLARDLSTEEQVISALADHVRSVVDASGVLSGVLQDILAAVCKPWLDTLSRDLGLMEQPAMSAGTEDYAVEHQDLDISMAEGGKRSDQAPALLTREDRSLVDETKASLTLLRQHLPVSKLQLGATDKPAESGIRPSECIVGFEDESVASISPWATEEEQLDYLRQLGARITLPPEQRRDDRNTGLQSTTLSALKASCLGDEVEVDLHAALLPSLDLFDELRPRAEAQSRRLNQMLLRHLFREHKLRMHLDLQHAFHLFGNGNFVTRLSTALFSEETQSAERRRGMVPTHETMGLQLGTRDGHRWPPASSELRLTLLGVLNEAYHGARVDNRAVDGKQLELPGGLSFSIRELPDADIDRVMDVDSLYALDFLRLQYTPSAPLNSILTPSAMQRYDDIFRYLLRLLRVLHTTTRLKRTCLAHQHGKDASGRWSRLAHHAHHFITALLSYTLDLGVATPWHGLQQQLDNVEKTLDAAHLVPKIGILGLRDMHIICLDSIRARLFLKRKQEKIRALISDVLSCILKLSAKASSHQADQDDVDVGELSATLDQTVGKLLAALRAAVVDRTPKTSGFEGQDYEDGEVMRLLLARLDGNGYYEATSQ
ncbi:hypothetical protein B0A50_02737 [Salinomyces thailandicus]|uniref:Spindle pole body component n=1 Tax=Salinomyces thailandicus TaxID=706561 RepID=A0A4U0U4W0_9PEZI|nr:hypothetical protein B0A50_02737 [Salinomyces thailandica]